MKKAAALFLILFVTGWIVRVIVPARSAAVRREQQSIRERKLEVIVEALYQFAETNRGKFPESLNLIKAKLPRQGNSIDLGNYLFRPSANFAFEKIDGKKLVVGENPKATTNTFLFLVSVEGRYTITLDRARYVQLLNKNGIELEVNQLSAPK